MRAPQHLYIVVILNTKPCLDNVHPVQYKPIIIIIIIIIITMNYLYIRVCLIWKLMKLASYKVLMMT